MNSETAGIIEKISEWDEVRSLVIKNMLKSFFPKVIIKEYKIIADLKKPCYTQFASVHERLVNTDILMCYNVLNENEVHEQQSIINNVRYILLLNMKRLLILLMEPAPNKSIARIRPFKEYLASVGKIIQYDIKDYTFDLAPLNIEYESDPNGLNRRLFTRKFNEKYNPIFFNNIKRIAIAATKKPDNVNSPQFAWDQIKGLRDKEKGYFVKKRNEKNQLRLNLQYK